MTYRGQRPKQTSIPAVGVNAPAAAREALGLEPIRPPKMVTAMPVFAPGPTGADGLHPPFAPETE